MEESQQTASSGVPMPSLPYGPMSQIQKSGNMFSQLEVMMAAVRKEAQELEKMKQKVKEMDEFKARIPEYNNKILAAENAVMDYQRQLMDSEAQCNQLRADMQHLNDMYSSERQLHGESQEQNTKLQQEFNQLRHEVIFLQREAQRAAELKKSSQALNSQILEMQTKIDDEKSNNESIVRCLEKKLSDAEKANSDTSVHFWNLTEEIKGLRQELCSADDKQAMTEQSLDAYKKKARLQNDRSTMIIEDQVNLLTRRFALIKKMEIDAIQSKRESDNLKNLLSSKDDANLSIASKLKTLEDARQLEKHEVKAKIVAMTEIISVLKSQSHELEREASDSRHKLTLANGDISRYIAEIDEFKNEMSRMEAQKLSKENDLMREVKLMSTQRDDAVAKFEKLTSQFESSQIQLQQQARSNQQRLWDEIQGLKSLERELQEEVQRLSIECQTKGAHIGHLEAEKAKSDEFMRTEVQSASGMVSTLRTELEKRLEELNDVRKDRDTCVEAKETLSKQLEDAIASGKRSEALFKKTIEDDRGKLQVETRQLMGRLKTLEVEKQELLRETNELVNQITDAQRETSRVRMEVDDIKKANMDLQLQLDSTKDRNSEHLNELKDAVRKEDELRSQLQQTEAMYKEDVNKLDSMIKDSKKQAAQQVVDISNRLKSIMEENEALKNTKVELIGSEKKLNSDIEKLKRELSLTVQNSDQVGSQMKSDIVNLRREVQELRSKSKLIMESKSMLEAESMNTRMEAGKLEMELIRAIDNCKEFEQKLKTVEDKESKLKIELDFNVDEVKKLKGKLSDAEEIVSKRNLAIDKLQRDFTKMERDNQADIRRLRLQINAGEQEIADLRPLIPMLQKELSEAKASYNKLQSSTNNSVGGLLDELRSTEDLLSNERKKSAMEIENYRGKMADLQLSLEKTREHIEEITNKSKVEFKDKDMKILQLENEIERVKSVISHKDMRIDELEKQHQSNRSKMHELKDKLENTEQVLTESRTNLELEQSQRRRLEARLRDASEIPGVGQGQMLAHNNGSGIGGLGYNATGNMMGTISNKMYSHQLGVEISNSDSMHRHGASNSLTAMAFGGDDGGNTMHQGSFYYNTSSNVTDNNNQAYEYDHEYDIISGDELPRSSNQLSKLSSLKIPKINVAHSDQADSNINHAGNIAQASSSQSLSGRTGSSNLANHQSIAQQRTSARGYRSSNVNNTSGISSGPVSPVLDRVSAALAARATAEISKQQITSVSPNVQNIDNDAQSTSAVDDMIQKTQKYLSKRQSGGGQTSGVSNDYNSSNNNSASNLNTSGVLSGRVLTPSSSFSTLDASYKSATDTAMALASSMYAKQSQSQSQTQTQLDINKRSQLQPQQTSYHTAKKDDDDDEDDDGDDDGGAVYYYSEDHERGSPPSNTSMKHRQAGNPINTKGPSNLSFLRDESEFVEEIVTSTPGLVPASPPIGSGRHNQDTSVAYGGGESSHGGGGYVGKPSKSSSRPSSSEEALMFPKINANKFNSKIKSLPNKK